MCIVGIDGIRETTWPGVYNRSRLPGRDDYFELPDWDCYVDSGKAITFIMPEEPWNQIEIAGAAWGKMELLASGAANDGPAESVLFERPQGQEKTVHTFATPITGRKIRFTNVQQEEPIGELVAYYVHPGQEPAGTAKLTYRLTAGAAASPDESTDPINKFILGRFPSDERQMMAAQPVEAGAAACQRLSPAVGAAEAGGGPPCRLFISWCRTTGTKWMAAWTASPSIFRPWRSSRRMANCSR